ncbi:MAG TPA: NAD-dependent deacylase [Rubricoccaceae bacterium]|nr:NAD-dependent deacylase [Rubricoccaceae bacterium]
MHQPVGDPFSETLVRRLAAAERVAVLTGAGISAESGVPTFRDPDGLWQRFRPEELANVEAFLKNPVLVQGWYAHRRAVVEEVAPNAGHEALAELERLVAGRGGDFLLATQNVDGLHRRAGSARVVELHGSLARTYCIECGREAGEAELTGFDAGEPARCPACGGLLRPDVVWFGEMLPEGAMETAAEAAARADVFLSVGTSAVVYPAAGLPLIAKEAGAYVAEVNPERSDIAWRLDEHVRGKAGEVLPALVARVREAPGKRDWPMGTRQ